MRNQIQTFYEQAVFTQVWFDQSDRSQGMALVLEKYLNSNTINQTEKLLILKIREFYNRESHSGILTPESQKRWEFLGQLEPEIKLKSPYLYFLIFSPFRRQLDGLLDNYKKDLQILNDIAPTNSIPFSELMSSRKIELEEILNEIEDHGFIRLYLGAGQSF